MKTKRMIGLLGAGAIALSVFTSCEELMGIRGEEQYRMGLQAQEASDCDHYSDSPEHAQYARGLEEAAKWYRIAAEKGHAEAQFRLASIYDTAAHDNWSSKKVFVDLGGNKHSIAAYRAEASKWYLKAIAQGHARAKERYEKFMKTGCGTTSIAYPVGYEGPTYRQAALGY